MANHAGRKGGSWTTYVNLSDGYVNNATHNYQGIKCVPCINKIMLHRVEKKNNRRKRKRTEQKTFKKMETTETKGERRKVRSKHYIHEHRSSGLQRKERGSLKKQNKKITKTGQSDRYGLQRRSSSEPVMLVHEGKCQQQQ